MTEQETSKELAELAVIGDDRAAEVARFKAATAEELAGFARHQEVQKQADALLCHPRGPAAMEAYAFTRWLEHCEEDRRNKADNVRLRAELAPDLLAKFDAWCTVPNDDDKVSDWYRFGREHGLYPETSIAWWLEMHVGAERHKKLVEDWGLTFGDAERLAHLSADVRARLLLDGKSIP